MTEIMSQNGVLPVSNGVTLRGKVWHVHLHVPTTLVPLFKRTQLRFSSKSKNKTVAIAIAARVKNSMQLIEYEWRRAQLSSDKEDQTFRINWVERLELFTLPDGSKKEITTRIDTGDPDEDTKQHNAMFGSPQKDASVQPKTAATLPDLIAQYCNERQQDSKITDKSKGEIRQALDTFQELIIDVSGQSNIPIDKIDRPILIQMKERLSQLPPRRKQLVKYKDLTIKSVIELRETNSDPVITEGTKRKILTIISVFGDWCHQFRHVQVNHFAKLADGSRHGPSEREMRKPYTQAQLAAIFSDKGVGAVEYHCDYWLPLLALYTGARLNELCQLRPEDVIEKNSVGGLVISVTGALTGTKNGRSRWVALHPKVLELGFLEFVERRRNQLTLLNEDSSIGGALSGLRWEGKNKFGRNPGRRFTRLLERVHAHEQGRAFHGFRHNLTDALKQAKVTPELISEIDGRTVGSITMDRYSERYSLATQLEALRKVDYGIDIVEAPDGLVNPRLNKS